MGAAAERKESPKRLNVISDAPANSNPLPADDAVARKTSDIDAEQATKPARARLISRKLLLGVAAAALLAAGAWYGEHWWTVGRFMVSTDDAYVRAQNTT